jgi:UDP-4-amino-4,6-dideoxy-N-acetyl-beta-L-altrosamine N-acetyltransferase
MITTTARQIDIVPLLDLDTETQLAVRDIRNEDGVRKWMYADHTIELNEHLAWINRLKADRNQLVFVVVDREHGAVGVVSLNAIDRQHKKADWAYYLAQDARGGLGSAIEFALIEFAFDVFGLEKLNCEVIEGNDTVVKLHKKFLFADEGFRRSNIVKDGKRRGVHYLGLTKHDWATGRQAFQDKYQDVLDKFAISFDWNEAQPGGKKHPLDEIEAARARNNLNWMNVLRLVLELSPENGKALVTDIRNIDREISELTDKLIAHES